MWHFGSYFLVCHTIIYEAILVSICHNTFVKCIISGCTEARERDYELQFSGQLCQDWFISATVMGIADAGKASPSSPPPPLPAPLLSLLLYLILCFSQHVCMLV